MKFRQIQAYLTEVGQWADTSTTTLSLTRPTSTLPCSPSEKKNPKRDAIERIAAEPDFGVATELPQERLEELYGTDKPTREMVAENMDFLEDVDRAIYCVLFRDGKPSEIFFAGMSYD
jgi:hypothetical protein